MNDDNTINYIIYKNSCVNWVWKKSHNSEGRVKFFEVPRLGPSRGAKTFSLKKMFFQINFDRSLKKEDANQGTSRFLNTSIVKAIAHSGCTKYEHFRVIQIKYFFAHTERINFQIIVLCMMIHYLFKPYNINPTFT